jgi:outer membrane lipoprotein SlyB
MDPQDAVGIGDGGLLGGLDVAALGGFGGQDLNGRVGAVCGDELHASRGDV